MVGCRGGPLPTTTAARANRHIPSVTVGGDWMLAPTSDVAGTLAGVDDLDVEGPPPYEPVRNSMLNMKAWYKDKQATNSSSGT